MILFKQNTRYAKDVAFYQVLMKGKVVHLLRKWLSITLPCSIPVRIFFHLVNGDYEKNL